MPLLSDSGRRKRARSAVAAGHATPLAGAPGAMIQFALAGETVAALAGGGLFIESARTLVVSDLHLEKGSWYAKSGQLLPPYDTRTTLRKLAAAMARLAPARVVSLGDSFHDLGGPARMDGEDRAALMSLVASVDWIWIEGNHDPEIPRALGGSACAEIVIDGLTLRHEPAVAAPGGEIAGHLHPCAIVAGRGRAVRARCFATDGTRLVMPAYGAYAGGLNIRDQAFARLFPNGALALTIGRARVLPVGPERLVGD